MKSAQLLLLTYYSTYLKIYKQHQYLSSLLEIDTDTTVFNLLKGKARRAITKCLKALHKLSQILCGHKFFRKQFQDQLFLQWHSVMS